MQVPVMGYRKPLLLISINYLCRIMCILMSIRTTTSVVTTEQCVARVLEDVPPDPYFDASDITTAAALELAEYLGSKAATNSVDETRRIANNLATDALLKDSGLLAVAIAAPILKLAVIQFRDHVENATNHSSYLGTYWRELGEAWNRTDGAQFWGAPFRDCGPMHGRWLWPFSVTVQSSGYKTVATSFIAADDDPCNDALESIFGKRHSCDPETTFCYRSLLNGSAVDRGSYSCLCNFGYYVPDQSLQGFEGHQIEASSGGNFSCIRCQSGKCMFFDEAHENVSMVTLIRASIGAVLGASILCCLVLGAIVFSQRKCKAISSGMWTVLETILLGIILLYSAVALHYFSASTFRCLLESWFRELGFIICYGAIILKLYRHLVEFRTRKAHRWVLRDVDLLKYLGTMVFAVICYMAAYTASSIDLIKNAKMEGLQAVDTNTCQPLKWEYVTQTSEILILVFGLHLAIASRNAKTQFRERQFLVASILIEFIVSGSFYTLRFFYLPQLSPTEILLALFVRSQITNTITIGLVFLPKLWYQHKQVRSLAHDLSCRLPVDAFKGTHETSHHGGGYAGICLGDPDIGELTISEMSPEDIRIELKRLYTQLEVLKNKTLRQDNPHISKRRGGRKQAHRRFSLQALSSKHRSNRQNQHDIEVTEAEVSRTPEDSVCSNEGPTDTGGEISNVTISK